MRIRTITLLCYIVSFTAILSLVNQTPIHTYITNVKLASTGVNQVNQANQGNQGNQANQANDPLYEEIRGLVSQVQSPAIDARMDKVWKAIPGLNGLEVDIEKSYQLAKQLGKVELENLYVHEIEPEVSLDDLPPNPIYRGNEKKPMVSFMINVAWGTEYVHQMLDIFDDYQVKATFFLDGTWLKKNSDTAKKIIERGHEVGNHAYSHPDLSRMSIERIKEEMVKTNRLIEEIGVKSYLFAPPSGAYDDRVVHIAHQLNMKTILWTLDTVDWKKPPADVIVQRIVPRLENGALILSHPTPSTVEALPRMIEGALNKELMIGPVSHLISQERSLSIVMASEL